METLVRGGPDLEGWMEEAEAGTRGELQALLVVDLKLGQVLVPGATAQCVLASAVIWSAG